MGVRFECPAGHPLHVKAVLAGRRAICPECGARFVVPNFSGGRATRVDGDAATAIPPVGAPTVSPDAPAGELWYVRPPTGGQFGPVDAPGFDAWAAEGRVTADSWVWRTGWPEWRPGGDVLAERRGPAAAADDRPAAAAATQRAGDDLPVPRPGEPLSAARRRRQQTNHRLTPILGVVALALLGALVAVLSR